MSAKKASSKRKSTSLHPRVKTWITWLLGRGLPAVLAVLIVAAFFAAWHYGWKRFGRKVISSDRYRLSIDRVDVTPPPEWIHADVRAEVFRDASLDRPMSIMDEDLNQRIFDAFSLHAWIAKVRHVRKHHPAGVKVELVYRRPVCMVRVSGELLPVDAEGVLLPPGDFSPVEAADYPQLVGIETVPLGPPGTRWGEPKVTGGAEIAAVLGLVWQQLGLNRIVTSSMVQIGDDDAYTYELFTRGGTRIIWGRAPGSDVPGEVPAGDKVAWLTGYHKENGTLDGVDGPQTLDVRDLGSVRVTPRTAATPDDAPPH